MHACKCFLVLILILNTNGIPILETKCTVFTGTRTMKTNIFWLESVGQNPAPFILNTNGETFECFRQKGV